MFRHSSGRGSSEKSLLLSELQEQPARRAAAHADEGDVVQDRPAQRPVGLHVVVGALEHDARGVLRRGELEAGAPGPARPAGLVLHPRRRDRKSTRLNSSHRMPSRMPSSA